MNTDFYITSDKSKLDVAFIHKYLSEQSYWAKGRTVEKVRLSIENSICFGVFNKEDKQVGFARITTDFVTVAWLMDVFIDKAYQGKGLGKMLVKHIVDLPEMQQVSGMGLKTKDAHELYKKFGFKNLESPEIWMSKLNK